MGDDVSINAGSSNVKSVLLWGDAGNRRGCVCVEAGGLREISAPSVRIAMNLKPL